MTKNLFAMIALGTGMAGIAMAQAPAAAAPQAAPATMSAPTKVGVIQIQAALAATKEGQKAAAELETKLAPRSDFPNEASFLNALSQVGAVYPYFEKRTMFRFSVGRTF